ncbi:MAG TPA: hypothetical protein VFP47_18815, partial [Pyrinomonadaceae bacterium]|nr:hypothetical protein [Pyrinomonadaceae bacterium]
MNSAKVLLLILTLTLTAATSQSQTRQSTDRGIRGNTIPINSGWQFREAGKDTWYPASVPGSVHTDLLNNKLINDPFYRDNEQKIQWIGKTNWEYQTTFNATPEILERDKIDLIFEGLDTYANVFVNDVSLLNADNMFRTWRADCKRLLKPGANTLRILFRSPINEVLPIMAKMTYQLPATNDQGEKTSPHTRKAPYQFGWDWGPRFVTSGVWRPVSLEAWDTARLEDLHILPKKVTAASAMLTAEVEVVANGNVSVTIIVDNLTDKRMAARRQVNLAPGSNRVALDFVVPRPRLWWPNGLGAQPLYSFKARLLINGKVTDTASTRTGLRSVELRQQPD